MKSIAAAILLLSLPAWGWQKDKGPKKPERPFTVFVRADPADETHATDDLVRGADELRKKLGDKKDWFRIVEEPEEAEIVVGVREHRVREHLTFWASTETIGGQTQGVTNSTISRYHSLRARISLLGSEVELLGVDPKRTGSVSRAASALQKELVELCRERYESLRKRRHP